MAHETANTMIKDDRLVMKSLMHHYHPALAPSWSWFSENPLAAMLPIYLTHEHGVIIEMTLLNSYSLPL